MIVSAAVKIYNKKLNKEMIIPCHRHCDAFYILKEFEYKKNEDYIELAQGFLDENDIFYDRLAAKQHALKYNQITDVTNTELYSEDLW